MSSLRRNPTMLSVLAERLSSLEFESIRGMARSLTLCLPYLPPFKPRDLRYQCGFRGRNSFKKPQASNRAFYPARLRPPNGGTCRRGDMTMADIERVPSGIPGLDDLIEGGFWPK